MNSWVLCLIFNILDHVNLLPHENLFYSAIAVNLHTELIWLRDPAQELGAVHSSVVENICQLILLIKCALGSVKSQRRRLLSFYGS